MTIPLYPSPPDVFHVWESVGRTQNLFPWRNKERHVFLFEKVIVLSKVIMQERNRKTDAYKYKDHLQVGGTGYARSISRQGPGSGAGPRSIM